MKINQIEYNLFLKYLNPLLGFTLVLPNTLLNNNMFSNNISMWDYEGFSIPKMASLLIALLILIYGLYDIYRNDDIKFEEEGMKINKDKIYVPYEDVNFISTSRSETQIHTKKGIFLIAKSFVKNEKDIDKMLIEELKFKKNKKGIPSSYFFGLACLVLLPLMFISKTTKLHKKIVERLPLKKIETIQIEGTIAKKGRITLFENNKGEMITYVDIREGLEEFPEIFFIYDSFSLDEQIENIKNTNPEDTQKFNAERNNKKEYKKLQSLQQGSKVKIKIRTKDYEDLKKYMASEENLNKPGQKFDSRSSLKFYEISLNDEIIVQKKNIK